MISLTINGQAVSAQKGETILDVCRRQDIRVPTLCHQPGLTPYGGCRLCVVDIEGYPRPMTACTTPVAAGMKVKTETPSLNELRRFTLQLILSEHPFSCLVCAKKEDCGKFMQCIEKEPIAFGCKYCSKNGTCELQKLVEELGIKEIPYDFRYRGLEIERQDPFFERDYNLCILCGRCVRSCQETRMASVIDFHHRGPFTLVGTAYGAGHLDAHCQFCGACIDACPTGAMGERYSKHSGAPDQHQASRCPVCSIGCAVNMNLRSGEVVNSTPDGGDLCVRGRFGIAPLIGHQKRARAPLIRKGRRTVEVSWDEALEHAAGKLREHLGLAGVIFSRNLALEAIESLKALKGCYFGLDEPGRPSLPFSLAGLSSRSALIVFNCDVVDDFSVLLLKIRRRFDLPVIVIDPLETKTVRLADIWLRPEPGNEPLLLRTLLAKAEPRNTPATADVGRARQLLAKRRPAVVYNPADFKALQLPKGIMSLPFANLVNPKPALNLGPMGMCKMVSNPDLKCLYLIGEVPHLTRRYEAVIVQDIFVPAIEFDVFLPAAAPGEFEGSFTGTDGAKVKFVKVTEPAGLARPDQWIIGEMIKRLGPIGLVSAPELVFRPPAAIPRKRPDKYRFNLLVRENCYRFRSFALSTKIKGFDRLRRDRALWVNSQDARRLHLETGQEVQIQGEALSHKIQVYVTNRVPEGTVFTYRDPSAGLIRNQPVAVRRTGSKP